MEKTIELARYPVISNTFNTKKETPLFLLNKRSQSYTNACENTRARIINLVN